MTVNKAGIGGDGPDEIATLDRSDPAGPQYREQVDAIENQLRLYVPEDNIERFVYYRQTRYPLWERDGAWGKAAVSGLFCFYVASVLHFALKARHRMRKEDDSRNSSCKRPPTR